MKRLLSIIGAISLVGTSTTSLVACNTQQEYTKVELAKLKEENKINTANQEIRDNLEGIAPQEKTLNKGNQKLYFVIGKAGNDGIISKFKDNYIADNISLFTELDKKSSFSLKINKVFSELGVQDNANGKINIGSDNGKNKNPIKSVYRGNLDTKEPDLVVDTDGIVKVKDE